MRGHQTETCHALGGFAIDALDATESRDLYEILIERYRVGSIVVTSNRGPGE
jgi:hypothetical protein